MRAIVAMFLLIVAGCAERRPAVEPAGGFLTLSDPEAGIEAVIAPAHGGEISSLKVRLKGQWVETLYLANDYAPRKGWTGKAPLLWPATGGTRGGYELGGERRQMPSHGFARGLEWTVMDQGKGAEAWVGLRLQDSPATREHYPFGFVIDVEHAVADGVVSSLYRVRAEEANDSPMPFSIGNHITFVTPLVEGSDWREMVFRTPSAQMFLKQEGGFPSGEMEPRSYADGIRLEEWPVKVPVSLTGYAAKPWMELEDPGGLKIRMSHSASKKPDGEYIQFNVWGDPSAGYFSPEPWMGMQNSLNLKKGLIWLEPGEEMMWRIEINVETF